MTKAVALVKRLGGSIFGWLARWLVVILPGLWLGLFFLLPFAIVFRLSGSTVAIAMPPYTPVFDWQSWGDLWSKLQQLTFANYLWIFGDPLYLNSYLSSLRIALISTCVTLLIGYPMALAMARAPRRWQPLLLTLVILPCWTSFLIRVYAWIGILKREGLLNQFLMSIGLIDEPLVLLYSNLAVYIGLVYAYLTFMVLPLYATLQKMDRSLIEAALDLRCRPWKAFWVITLPLSLPGILAGSLLVFIPSVGEFLIPDLLGGSDTLMIGKTLWMEFFNNRDWPVASAVAIVLLLLLIVPIRAYQRAQSRL